MTFMNRSGASVAPLARFFKIEAKEILVVHDELDLLPGQVKLKFGGSAAGHNGLKDIQGLLGTSDFWRLRLGIGHPGVKSEVANYVLKKPSAEHRDAIALATERSLQASDRLLAGEMDAALALIHAQPPRPKPPRPAVVPVLPVSKPEKTPTALAVAAALSPKPAPEGDAP
jgi:PTH1 family peptidyl-tRNA hydrolase